jgi:hypothetical protein
MCYFAMEVLKPWGLLTAEPQSVTGCARTMTFMPSL